ncbi:MAG: glycoside hydrolase family 88 protein, partial [Bacteroidota bacterium]
DSLYYRDYNFFDKLTENGKKIFWGRGNGWVVAGLARFIPFIPEGHPERAFFVEQFQAMAAKLIQIQDPEDGMWRVSLLDPEYLNQGESSGTAFFTWALAWGINAGLLDETTYRPAVEKAWLALCNNVNAEGRLGYVQQVASSPYPFYDHQYHLYASGAFLGAGMEMIRLIGE